MFHVASLGLQVGSPAPNPVMQWVPMVVMLGLAWVLLIRPVQKQRREQADMRASLKAGDSVLTSGGIYGTVKRVQDDRVSLRIADGVQVDVARAAIASVSSRDERE